MKDNYGRLMGILVLMILVIIGFSPRLSSDRSVTIKNELLTANGGETDFYEYRDQFRARLTMLRPIKGNLLYVRVIAVSQIADSDGLVSDTNIPSEELACICARDPLRELRLGSLVTVSRLTFNQKNKEITKTVLFVTN